MPAGAAFIALRTCSQPHAHCRRLRLPHERLAIELDADQAHVVDVGVNANVITVLAELGDGRHSEQWR